jgi:DNA polymerase delta subunit 3
MREEEEEEEETAAAGKTTYDEPASEPEEIKPKPRKKKEKKVIPVGKNGLKKKKTLKSRTRVDDKGYMGKVMSRSCMYY